MKKAQFNKWIIGIVALIFLMAGNAWADGKRHHGDHKNGGHHIAKKHGHGHHGAYHNGRHHKPRPHHHYRKPHHRHHGHCYRCDRRDHRRPQHVHKHHHHHHYHHNRHDRSATANIRINPDPNRVFLSALFANPALLFDISISD